MGKSFFYLGNTADGALYFCNDDRTVYLFPPQVTGAEAKERSFPFLSSFVTGASIFGYLLLRELSFTYTAHFSWSFIVLYCLLSAAGGLGIAFTFIGFMKERMRNNSSNFVPLEKISDNDYLHIRAKLKKQLPLIYCICAFLVYALVSEPFVWSDYIDVVTFFAYFLVWAVLAVLMYLFSPMSWYRAMKALRQIRSA